MARINNMGNDNIAKMRENINAIEFECPSRSGSDIDNFFLFLTIFTITIASIIISNNVIMGI
jgi:hypothetical protein